MISPPLNPVYATSFEDFKYLENNNKINILPFHEVNSLELEVFKYNPRLFSHGGLVDDLTLYLSFKDSNDERIVMALTEMMEEFKW